MDIARAQFGFLLMLRKDRLLSRDEKFRAWIDRIVWQKRHDFKHSIRGLSESIASPEKLEGPGDSKGCARIGYSLLKFAKGELRLK
ncbi:MAG: hypothetical protein AB1540_12440 [Bdellovibrionota bacterium]